MFLVMKRAVLDCSLMLLFMPGNLAFIESNDKLRACFIDDGGFNEFGASMIFPFDKIKKVIS